VGACCCGGDTGIESCCESTPAGECGAGCGGAGTAAGGGVRAPIAAAAPGQPTRGAGAGEQIDAATALAWGLVHNVVAPSDLDAAVNRVADRFAELGGSVVRQQKKLLRSWEDMPLDQAITESVPEFGVAFGTGEPQKIMAEFVNRKRSP